MTNGDQNTPNPASALQNLMKQVGQKKRGPSPVEKWNPDFCGDLDMEIRRDGTWFYMGTPIGRKALVELFAGVLRKDEDGKTYLVTPVEKIGLRVVDAHFVGVELAAEGEGATQILTIRTNVGDVATIDAAHPLRFAIEKETGGVKPYVLVRGRLEALLSRAVTHELMALCETFEVDGQNMFGVWSSGVFFAIMPAADITDA